MSTETIADPVSHPPHYTSSPASCSNCGTTIECIDVTRHMGFDLGNAVKYVWRADLKENTIQDLEKAVWYIQDEIATRKKVAGAAALPQANLLPHIEHVQSIAADLAYQEARAEYFRYAPEIEHDPEGVQRLKIAMHAARAALNPSE